MTPEQRKLYVDMKLNYYNEHKDNMTNDEFLKTSKQIKEDVMNNKYKTINKYDELENLLKEKEIPYTRTGNEFSTYFIFHEDLIKYAEQVGLYAN
jgi:hypothetical protein